MQSSIPFYNVHDPSVCIPLEKVLRVNGTEGGYYIPQQIPSLPDSLIYKDPPPSFRDVAFEVFRSFLQDAISESDLYTLIARAFPFKVPVFPIDPRTYIVELTHGDGGSYTDFGARFTALLIDYFCRHSELPMHILFAGSELETLSLAKAFSEFEDIHATFLYPKDDVQDMIKQQFISLPENIHIFNVNGSLDDCKAIIAEITEDADMSGSMELFIPHPAQTTYLLSQVCCCLYAVLTVLSRAGYDNNIEQPQLIIGTPLKQPNAVSAAVLAKKMGAPINGFIATADFFCNDPQIDYEEECTRVKMLYTQGNTEECIPEIALFRLNQDSIVEAMRDCKERTGYVVSPDVAAVWHAWGAVRNGFTETAMAETIENFCLHSGSLPGWLSDDSAVHSCITIIPEISHPAFYSEMVRTATGIYPSVPHRFEYNQQTADKPILECSSVQELKDWLLSLI